MTYLILAKFERRHEVVKVVEGTDEEAQAKAQEIYDLNKDRFKDIEVTLFAGDYVPLTPR